jgi:beta-lactamase superfamily II metal-dependent hydrolase
MANGQSTLIEVPANGRNQTLLVGAGSNPRIANTPWSEYQEELTDQLETNSNGKYVVDHLVVSHNHTDHISYVDDILNDDTIVVRNLYFNGIRNEINAENHLNSAVTSTTSTAAVREGDRFTVGEATVDVLNPDSSADEVENNPRSTVMDRNSIVLHVQHDSGDVLTTGDIRGTQEASLAQDYNSQLSSVDILIASHHGTSSSSEAVVTDGILDATGPQTVIISNSNQMSTSQTDRYAPDCAVFSRADDRNIPVYWTAVHGEIQFTGESFSRTETEAGVSDPDDLQSRLPYSC